MKLKDILSEGLIVTRPMDFTVEYMNKWFNDGSMSFNESNSNKIWIVILKQVELELLNSVFKTMNNLGWYPSYFMKYSFPLNSPQKFNLTYFLEFIKTELPVILYFEAKFDVPLNGDEIPDKSYHITPKKYLNKILSIGLVPKSKEQLSYHPDRIYLSYNKDGLKILFKNKKFISDEIEFSILQIDTKKLYRERVITFYKDPNFQDFGFYSLRNIPKEYIMHVEDVNR